MSMTRREKAAKDEIMKILKKEGYVTYAKLLSNFDVNLTTNPKYVGYIDLRTGTMVLNEGLDIDQVSVIVRHEILHEYLEHIRRLLVHLAQKQGLDFDELDDLQIKELKRDLLKNKVFNYAGDYEISNRGYTEADKETVRNIQLNGQTLSGLVTEDEHPDWVNLSVEELYDKISEMEPPKIENVFGALKDPTTFVGVDGVVYGA